MKLILIRHGMTAGNVEKRYIGITDESLCEKGIESLRSYIGAGIYPMAEMLFVSPLRRCIETAELIYPTLSPMVINDFRECDFGLFEGKNYQELTGNPYYQKWIDSNGALPFPEGEAVEDFKHRCISAFERCIRVALETDRKKADRQSFGLSAVKQELTAAMVIHGGTIMAIMEYYGMPKKSYYDYQVANGMGYIGEYRDGRLWDVHALGVTFMVQPPGFPKTCPPHSP